MQRGHANNATHDYVAAHACFDECFRLGGRTEAAVSAANMSFKLNQFEMALQARRQCVSAVCDCCIP